MGIFPSYIDWTPVWLFAAGIMVGWFIARWIYLPREGESAVEPQPPSGFKSSEFWLNIVAKIGIVLVTFGGMSQAASDQIASQLTTAVGGIFAVIALWQMAKGYTTNRTELKKVVLTTYKENGEESQVNVFGVKHTIGLLLLLGLSLGFVCPASAEMLPWRDRIAKQLAAHDAALNQQRQAPAPIQAPQPQYIYLSPPLQQIPLGGPPLQQIPLGGPPLQQIPLGGPPLQQIPIGPPPLQQIPIGPMPLQRIEQGTPPLQQIQQGVPPGQQAPRPSFPQTQPQPTIPLQQIPLAPPAAAPAPTVPVGPPAATQRLSQWAKALYR